MPFAVWPLPAGRSSAMVWAGPAPEEGRDDVRLAGAGRGPQHDRAAGRAVLSGVARREDVSVRGDREVAHRAQVVRDQHRAEAGGKLPPAVVGGAGGLLGAGREGNQGEHRRTREQPEGRKDGKTERRKDGTRERGPGHGAEHPEDVVTGCDDGVNYTPLLRERCRAVSPPGGGYLTSLPYGQPPVHLHDEQSPEGRPARA